MKMCAKKQTGFTIVELLIVIVVIAILAAISVVAYNGIQDRARLSKINSDVNSIRKAIDLARTNNSVNLLGITGSTASGGNCWGKASGTDLASLPSSDGCFTAYAAAMNAIGTASGVTGLANLRDPWGRPYLIDENEGEGSPTNCTRDTVSVYKLPFTTGFGVYTGLPANNVSLGGYGGCS